MGILHLNAYSSNVAPFSISKFNHNNTGTATTTTTTSTHEYLIKPFLPASNNYKRLSCSRGGKLTTMRAAIESKTIPSTETEVITASEVELPSIDFAFVSSVLLPDGTPDIQIRSACGGQKLRDIMLDSNIELYGPYARLLLNCGGGGSCGTCMVEVIEGKELLGLRTDKEKEVLKRKPKTWRLACQTTVGEQDSRGEIVIQQLPEWKVHEWTYDKNEAAAAAQQE